MTESLKAFDPNVKEVMWKPVRACLLLRHSSLPPKERAAILGHAANKFDYEKIVECLEVMYDDEALRDFDKQIARRQPSQLSKGIFVQVQQLGEYLSPRI